MKNIAVFTSRSQAIRLKISCSVNGINAEIISTPENIFSGCSLSVMFDDIYKSKILDLIYQKELDNFVGVYEYY